MQRHFLRQLFRQIPFAIAVVLVAYFSLTNTDGLDDTAIADFFLALGKMSAFGPDKWVHASMYAVLTGTFLFTRAFASRRLRWIWCPLVVFLFGFLMELCQLVGSTYGWINRSFDLSDVLANGIGACAGAAFYWIGKKCFRCIFSK